MRVGKAIGSRESAARRRAHHYEVYMKNGGHGAKSAFVVLSQKVARFNFENQLFEEIQV
jgi:hypothetical protein